MIQNHSPIDRMLSTSRPLGLKLGISILILLVPFGAAALDGVLGDVFRTGFWRVMMLPAVFIIYVWAISPVISRMSAETIQAARSLVSMDEASFAQLVTAASRTNPVYEWIALIIGVALGLFGTFSTDLGQYAFWIKIYWYVGMCLMYGFLAWAIYTSFASTRLNAAIHRQQLSFDIFDLTPFDAFGRYSLALALAFVGGMTISLVLTFQVQSLFVFEFWIVYLILAVITVLIFFMSMRPTHQVLSKEKYRELGVVREHILRASRDLMRHLEQNQVTSQAASEINALAVYEQRLQAARTWPYNTSMLRTLFFSVLIPLGSLLVKEALEFLAGG